MPSPLHQVQQFPAPPATVYARFTDRAFLQGRLDDCGGLDPQITELNAAGDTATIVTRQSIPASVLPPMVASMMAGNPATERTEKWHATADGYAADFTVTIKGAPASLAGTMTLTPDGDGSTLTVEGQASVPIPLFGGKIEQVIVEQVGSLLQLEGDYTREHLSA